MTNIVHIDKSRGFTRMDNTLMEALATVDLPARELRVLMAIARQTIGYQQETRRLSADDLGKLTNMRRDVTSKAISHLLGRRIIYRVGGSRGDIGISPVAEWAFYEAKTDSLTETKSSHSAQIVSLRHDASETKTATSLLYTKKEKPPITLPSEEIITPQAQTASAKPERKTPFGKSQMLADNPHQVSELLIDDYLAVRRAKKAPMTARVWSGLNAKLEQCKAFGILPNHALTIAIDNGWQGFEVEWITRRAAVPAQPATQSRHHGFSDRDYTAGLITREDGSYAF